MHNHHRALTTCTHHLEVKERKTRIVVIISFITMVLELVFGYITNSMALLSDGWHMSSHVLAIGAGWLTYKYVLREQKNNTPVNAAKILAIAGFVNGILLIAIAGFVLLESLERFCAPLPIAYHQAALVSFIGLIVNLVSAKILHHDSAHSDHNLQATYLHIAADILTSVLALIALLSGLYFQINTADALAGLFGSLVIIYWTLGVLRTSSIEIFDAPQTEKP
jgi:cation diffusion facilitator family transporter